MGVVQFAITTLVTFIWPLFVPAQKIPTSEPGSEEATRLVGRVLAWQETFALGADLGPKYQVFVFAVGRDRGEPVTPIKVAYAFFKSDGLLPDSFFDYSKQYELQAVRDARCDESVKSLSYVKNVDESGKPLPPSYVLRFLGGAPRDVLKPDAVLACYVLRPSKYRVLNQEKDGAPPTPTTP
jgi:hypothetical protein